MAKAFFHYEKSTRSQARKMGLIAMGFPVSIWLMIELFAGGKLSGTEVFVVYGSAFAVSGVLLTVFVIPDLFRKALFRYEVTDEWVTCVCPGGESYRLKVNDIARLLQVKQTTGQIWVDEYIETNEGKLYSIPKRYDLDIYAVIKAIRSADPGILRENEVRY